MKEFKETIQNLTTELSSTRLVPVPLASEAVTKVSVSLVKPWPVGNIKST